MDLSLSLPQMMLLASCLNNNVLISVINWIKLGLLCYIWSGNYPELPKMDKLQREQTYLHKQALTVVDSRHISYSYFFLEV